jgi:N-acetylneuraminic acid mutarotase
MKAPAVGLRRRAGAILAIDALALAAVLATGPAAFVWLDGSRPSPLVVDSSGGSGSGSAHSPGSTPSVFGATTQAPVQTVPPATPVPSPKITYGDGTWDPLPPMPRSLWGAGSAVLGDGRVLVIGGLSGPNSASALATVEVFDPKSNSWDAAAPMLQARAYPAAATLADGSVLVAGGSRGGVPLDGAERYFPDSGTWVSAGVMSAPRTEARATMLRDGRVLVTGGGSEAPPSYRSTNAAEIFDPVTGSWTSTAPMSTARAFHTATLLSDGEVLVTGGASIYHGSKGAVVATAEIYDPKTATWHAAARMSVARYHHVATLLPDGRVLVAGGWAFTTNSDKSLATAEIYDPAKNTWKATGSMATGRARGSITPLPDGRVLVVGGVDTAYRVMATAEIWDPSTGKWRSTGRLATAVMWPALALLHDGRVLLAGGAVDVGAAHATSASAIFAPPAP